MVRLTVPLRVVFVLATLLVPAGANAAAASSVREFSIPLREGASSARAASVAPVAPRAEEVPGEHAGDDDGPWQTFPAQATQRFDLVGVRWTRNDPGEVQLRVRRTGRPWGQWTTAGEPESGERSTSPMWTGGSDVVQVRVQHASRGLRLHAIRVAGRTDPTLTVRAAATGGAQPTGGVTPAQAVTPGTGGVPAMVTRAQWDPTNECAPRTQPVLGQIAFGIVHHTVSSNLYTSADGPAMVLAICRYHRNANRWNDLGYNFLVDRFGTIYEGRAGGIDQPIVGAHAQGFNTTAVGIANLGTFSDEGQTSEGLRATARVLAWKLGIHGVPLTGTTAVASAGGESSRFEAGQLATVERIAAHRDVGHTECPGEDLYGQLTTIRSISLQMPRGVPPALPTVANGAVTLVAPNPTAIYGAQTQLTGAATAAGGGGPLANAEIRVQAQTAAGWKTVATSTTDEFGAWSAAVTARQTRTLRAVAFAGGLRAATSSGLALAVTPTLNGTSATRVVAGMPLTVTGTITPAKSKVTFEIARQGRDGVYRTVARIPVRPKRGRLTHRTRLSRPALHRLRWVFAGDALHATTSSTDLYVRAVRGGPARGGARAR